MLSLFQNLNLYLLLKSAVILKALSKISKIVKGLTGTGLLIELYALFTND